MGYIRGADRNEVLLFPECVEDYISADNPVRLIEAFVESLDLAELGFVGRRLPRPDDPHMIRQLCCGCTSTGT